MMPLKKSNVFNAYDLQVYLQQQSLKADRLYHFTTYDSLIQIIKNKSFRLSRMDLLNDKAEPHLGNKNEQIKNYIMSFTRDKEYVSMWAMYGKPSGIKIRLDFSRKLFIETINNNFYEDSTTIRKIPVYSSQAPEQFYKKDFLISDIVYFDKKTDELRHNEKPFINIKADENLIDEMTGFIKYDVWEFERETRLRVQINSHSHNKSNTQDLVPKYIYAGINYELIKDFHVTFNPWISAEMREEIQKSIASLSYFGIKCDPSEHDGEIIDL